MIHCVMHSLKDEVIWEEKGGDEFHEVARSQSLQGCEFLIGKLGGLGSCEKHDPKFSGIDWFKRFLSNPWGGVSWIY